ncbi:UNVERIFIED_CONTAM: hypothetical protein FKN15_066537 [Acipenser sinensis]
MGVPYKKAESCANEDSNPDDHFLFAGEGARGGEGEGEDEDREAGLLHVLLLP